MKKGFTLIELLAVIVILAVIALIATPTITEIIEKARIGSAKESANGYIEAINNQKAINLLDSDSTNDINEGVYDAPLDSKYRVKVKGHMPTGGWIYIGKNGVTRGSLIIENKYVVNYENDEIEVIKGNTPSERTLFLDEVANVGDYVIMTPTSTSYEIDGLKTGSGEDDIDTSYFRHWKQNNKIINPSLQNRWVVIKKNNDGTIEMVSDEINDVNIVVFFGKTGYKNYVGVMEEIAAQYANDKYTISTRNIGYNNQTLYINNEINRANCGSEPEEIASGSKSVKEEKGGGDRLYFDDINLIVNAYKKIDPSLDEKGALSYGMTPKNSSGFTNYSVSGRLLRNSYAGTYLYTKWYIMSIRGVGSRQGDIVWNQGELDTSLMYSYNHTSNDVTLSIRPIIVLKPNLKISGGDGKSKETPWTLK